MAKPRYTGCVYRATLIVGSSRKRRCYIGKSVAGLKKRISTHYAQAKRGINTHFASALLAYRPEAFAWEVLFSSNDDDALKQCEIEQIAAHRAEGWSLYNHSDGGDGCKGWKWTPELRTRIAAKYAQMRAEGTNKRSEQGKANMRAAFAHRVHAGHSDAAKANMSKAKKEWWAKRKAANASQPPLE